MDTWAAALFGLLPETGCALQQTLCLGLFREHVTRYYRAESATRRSRSAVEVTYSTCSKQLGASYDYVLYYCPILGWVYFQTKHKASSV